MAEQQGRLCNILSLLELIGKGYQAMSSDGLGAELCYMMAIS